MHTQLHAHTALFTMGQDGQAEAGGLLESTARCQMSPPTEHLTHSSRWASGCARPWSAVVACCSPCMALGSTVA